MLQGSLLKNKLRTNGEFLMLNRKPKHALKERTPIPYPKVIIGELWPKTQELHVTNKYFLTAQNFCLTNKFLQ